MLTRICVAPLRHEGHMDSSQMQVHWLQHNGMPCNARTSCILPPARVYTHALVVLSLEGNYDGTLEVLCADMTVRVLLP